MLHHHRSGGSHSSSSMKVSMPRRVPTLVAVTIVSGSLTAVPLAAPASATAVAQCAALSAPAPQAVGGVLTRRAQLGGCTPASATGGSGSSVTNLNTRVNIITWAGGVGTTTTAVTYKAGTGSSNCPGSSHLTIIGGKVTGGSGAARNAIKVGSTVSARWCVTPKLAVTLEPGSALEFNGTSTPTDDNPPPPRVPLPATLSECPANAASAVTALANRDRKQTTNAPPLRESPNLDWAARKHAIAMAAKGYSFHDGWDTEIYESHFKAGPPY